MHYGHGPQPVYRMPAAAPNPPHHMLPVPRPVLPRLTFHATDMPVGIWATVWIGLAGFSLWYALAYAHYEKDAQAGLLATAAFALVAVLFVVWWMFRIRRRRRIFTHGRVVQGFQVGDVTYQVINRYGQRANQFSGSRIGFEDKLLHSGKGIFSESPIVYVDGAWAGVYENGRYITARWSLRPLR